MAWSSFSFLGGSLVTPAWVKLWTCQAVCVQLCRLRQLYAAGYVFRGVADGAIATSVAGNSSALGSVARRADGSAGGGAGTIGALGASVNATLVDGSAAGGVCASAVGAPDAAGGLAVATAAEFGQSCKHGGAAGGDTLLAGGGSDNGAPKAPARHKLCCCMHGN